MQIDETVFITRFSTFTYIWREIADDNWYYNTHTARECADNAHQHSSIIWAQVHWIQRETSRIQALRSNSYGEKCANHCDIAAGICRGYDKQTANRTCFIVEENRRIINNTDGH